MLLSGNSDQVPRMGKKKKKNALSRREVFNLYSYIVRHSFAVCEKIE